jgi:NADH-quinone oxidoreductase E subunit
MKLEFSPEELQKIETLKNKYPESKAALMAVIWMAQKKWGWISDDVKECISELLCLPYSHVHGVVSFYTMYFKKQMGRHHIQVCTNISCMLRKGDEIFKHVSDRLGIGHMECTPDGKYSLEEVECMGACGGAPMVAINEDYFENIDIVKLDSMIDSLQ